jgi:glutamate carboxypeptidase
MVARIEELVNIDSGSFTAEGVNRVADLCQARFEASGWKVQRQRHRLGPETVGPPLGDMVVRPACWAPASGRWWTTFTAAGPHGHSVRRRYGGRASVSDPRRPRVRARGRRRQGGVVCGFEAAEVLCDLVGFDDLCAITLVCSPDEEIGSPFSRPLIEALAREHDLAVGLEAARTNGDLVSARKGIAAFTVEVEGKAVHAGVRPTEGVKRDLGGGPTKRSAFQALNGRWPEVTCNVGVLQGGGRINVVPDRAVMRLEVRAATTAALELAMAEVTRIVTTTTVPGARLSCSGRTAMCPWSAPR